MEAETLDDDKSAEVLVVNKTDVSKKSPQKRKSVSEDDVVLPSLVTKKKKVNEKGKEKAV